MILQEKSFSLSLTKDQTLMLKAIAILLIMIHNFSRWVDPITGESEFYFNQSALFTAIHVGSTNIWMFIKAFFNYFGHYGVQIFVFLSGYGLVQSFIYEKQTWINYIYHRFQKLYPSLVIAVLVFLLYQVFVMHQFLGLDTLPDFFAHLTLTATLLPDKGQALVGPWWFYSTIFQLYLIFPILIKVYLSYGSRWLLIIGLCAWTLVQVYASFNNLYSINIRETFVGQMPVFILGIWFGTDLKRCVSLYTGLALFIVFCLGCYLHLLWPLTHLCVTILLVIIGKGFTFIVIKTRPSKTTFLFIGKISVYLFAIHGFMRWPFAHIINMNQDNLRIAYFMLLLFLSSSFLLAWCLTKIEGLWRNELLKIKSIFFKILFTTCILLIPITLLIWGYNWHFQKLNPKYSIAFQSNLEETCDSTMMDVKFQKTQTGERVLWLRNGLNMSHIESFNIPQEKLQDISWVHICSNVCCDSIPEECWLIAESYLGKIRLSRKSVKLNTSLFLPNHWQPLELSLDLQSPLVLRKELFQFYFFAKSSGNVFIDQIHVKLE